MTCEFWMHGFPVPGQTQPLAVRAEELGFDGLLLADSQNLVGDPFVELGLLTRVTTRLGLGTGIVNPVTRHPAVVASAVASLQVESGGRAALGLGRGDSSLGQIGVKPPTTDQLAVFLRRVRGYLRGEEVDLADGPAGRERAQQPSRIAWIAAADLTPPPVELAATGPRTIALAATASDRVMLTLGADRDRIAAAIELARAARAAAGLPSGQLRVGAYLNVGCHPDLAVARDLVRGSAAIFARFSALSAAAAAGLDSHDGRVVADVGAGYDLSRHGLARAAAAGVLDDEFLDRFAVLGPAERCAGRLRELIALGLDRIVVVPGSRDSDPALLDAANAALAREVLPALRGGPPDV
ncbi:MAG TPA: LLM class flavin-dependent oxidoreductase [Streptosporangiaceae bacterium]|nr:LLM class flavin-dependent oxidoreductase [Streptosporangiaceae bacterium]